MLAAFWTPLSTNRNPESPSMSNRKDCLMSRLLRPALVLVALLTATHVVVAQAPTPRVAVTPPAPPAGLPSVPNGEILRLVPWPRSSAARLSTAPARRSPCRTRARGRQPAPRHQHRESGRDQGREARPPWRSPCGI